MNRYKCRNIRMYGCEPGTWVNINAKSEGDAANEFFSKFGSRVIYYNNRLGNGLEVVYFGVVEVEGYGQFYARYFKRPIVRSGGVRLQDSKHTLEWVAKEIGWEGPIEELLSPGWEYEDANWE